MQLQLFFFLNEYSRCFFWEVSLETFCIVVINKQKYCFERKNWIAIQAKKIMLSLLYHFWKKIRELKISIKHARNQQKVVLILVIRQSFWRGAHSEAAIGVVLPKKVSWKISQIPEVKHLCWSLFRQWQQLEVFCRKRCS